MDNNNALDIYNISKRDYSRMKEKKTINDIFKNPTKDRATSFMETSELLLKLYGNEIKYKDEVLELMDERRIVTEYLYDVV